MTKQTSSITPTIPATTPEDCVTIVLDRPRRVRQSVWPLVAKASSVTDAKGNPSFRRWFLRVRRHAKDQGRAIAYGWHQSDWAGEHPAHAGRECPWEDVPSVIKEVATEIGAPDWMAAQCITSLPEEDLG